MQRGCYLLKWERALLLRFHVVAFVKEQRNSLCHIALFQVFNHLIKVGVEDDAEALDELLVLQVVDGFDHAWQQQLQQQEYVAMETTCKQQTSLVYSIYYYYFIFSKNQFGIS